MTALTSGYVLHAHPFGPWLLQKAEPGHGAQGTETAHSLSDQRVTQGTYVTLEHFWSHVFGVTLALKTINDPHNRSKNVRIMVWRCQLPLETYRRLCVMVNWQVNQSQKEQSLESV